jgi:hypothetical protein
MHKSSKQGPSHRKIRRWNNDNFVNLAAKIHNKGGRTAAQVLLLGQADAAQYRSVYDLNEHQSTAMAQLRQDELSGVREQFFEGELPHRLNTVVVAYNPNKHRPKGPLTPEHMMNRIDARLRRVVVKACENSYPASKVVHTLEAFLVRAYAGKSDTTPRDAWKELLLEPPTVTHRKRDDTYITKFLFDADSSTGGFHRLLLHGLCQFHGLGATSSSMQVVVEDGKG